MAEELLDPAFVRLIWPYRERIRSVRVIAWEPYIPWELLRFRHPDTEEIDERHFCEYGLIREIRGQRVTRRLVMRDWSYLEAAYPVNSRMPAIDDQAKILRNLLHGHGIVLRPIEPSRAAAITSLDVAVRRGCKGARRLAQPSGSRSPVFTTKRGNLAVGRAYRMTLSFENKRRSSHLSAPYTDCLSLPNSCGTVLPAFGYASRRHHRVDPYHGKTKAWA
jgi:hypothetical protein